MKCPIDDTPLSVSSRDGVEIDFCPQCRGVWLDRGELDKIIDRAANTIGAGGPPPPASSGARGRDVEWGHDRDVDERRAYGDDRRYGEERRPRKRRSFLDDLFEFD